VYLSNGPIADVSFEDLNMINFVSRHMLALFVAIGLMVSSVAAQADESLSKADVEKIVQDYLMENPDFLLNALINMQQWQEEQEKLQQAATLAHAQELFLNDPNIPSVGPADAKVTVVEFFDYHCGYCKRAFAETMALTEGADDVRVLFLEFPILSEESGIAARAALAAHKQGKYMDLHTAFMQARGRLNQSRIDEIAAEVGVDVAQMKADMASPVVEEAIARNRLFARQLDISGTPAFIVGNDVVPGANMPMVRQLVEAARAEG
jgi:protein-disulfide isomerase